MNSTVGRTLPSSIQMSKRDAGQRLALAARGPTGIKPLPNAPSSRQARNERYDEDNEEDEEQELCDPGRCDCDAAEAEDRGDDGYRQEDQSPIEHRATPSLPSKGNRAWLQVVPAPTFTIRPPIMRA
jgi:hypothetical protein